MRQIILSILITSLGALVGGLWWMEARKSEAGEQGPLETADVLRGMAAGPSEAEEREEIESTPSPVGERSTSGPVPGNLQTEIGPRLIRLEGRFVDPWNLPLAGVELQLGFRRTWQRIATTDEAGSFGVDVEIDRTPFYVKPVPDIWICGGPLKFDAEDPPGELFVRATRLLHFEGKVMSDHGEPVPGGRLHLVGPGGLVGKPGGPFDFLHCMTKVGRDGSFRTDIPSYPDLTFVFYPPSEYRTLWDGTKVPVALEPREDWILTVPLKENVIAGTVRSASGQRIAGDVYLGSNRCRTDSIDGRFSFTRRRPLRPDENLVAIAPGHAPSIVQGIADRFVSNGFKHPPIDLVLEEAGTIRGRVIDANGEPAAGSWIGLLDPTPAGKGAAEGLAGGTRLPLTVGEEGRFEVGGLSRRAYRLRALHPETLAYVDSAPTMPGDSGDVLLHLPAVEARIVSGRVVHREGAVGQADVVCGVSLPGAEMLLRKSRTDPQGWFRFDGMPDLPLSLDVSSHHLVPRGFEIPAGDSSGLELSLLRKAWFRVAWPAGEELPEGFEVLDREGRPLGIGDRRDREMRKTSGRLAWQSSPRSSTRPAISADIAVPETAWLIALQRNGKEILRLPLELEPGRTVIVEP